LTDVLQEVVAVKRVSAFLRNPDVEYLDEPEDRSDVAQEGESLTVQGDIAWSTPSAQSADNASEPFILRNLDIAFQRGEITLIAGKFGSGKSLLLLAVLGEVALLRGHISYAISPVADPWQAEQAVDWTNPLEGLAFVPQVCCREALCIRSTLIVRLLGYKA
jgi:ABC-type bacteriocin/lantibiotic exporter with double-glycine peptidase domain